VCGVGVRIIREMEEDGKGKREKAGVTKYIVRDYWETTE